MRKARCLLIEKLIKAVVTLPLNTLQNCTVVNTAQGRRHGRTEVVLLEGIRHLEAASVNQVGTTIKAQISHIGSHAWTTYAHVLESAITKARSEKYR